MNTTKNQAKRIVAREFEPNVETVETECPADATEFEVTLAIPSIEIADKVKTRMTEKFKRRYQETQDSLQS